MREGAGLRRRPGHGAWSEHVVQIEEEAPGVFDRAEQRDVAERHPQPVDPKFEDLELGQNADLEILAAFGQRLHRDDLALRGERVHRGLTLSSDRQSGGNYTTRGRRPIPIDGDGERRGVPPAGRFAAHAPEVLAGPLFARAIRSTTPAPWRADDHARRWRAPLEAEGAGFEHPTLTRL